MMMEHRPTADTFEFLQGGQGHVAIKLDKILDLFVLLRNMVNDIWAEWLQ